MAVTADIISSWRHPRAGVRRHLARGMSEPFAFSLLVAFLIIAFIGQWPVASRDAFLAGEPSAAPRLLARGLAVLATIPFWYGLAALARLIAGRMGGQGTWYSARIALFWALVTVSPLLLLQGLVQGMIGQSPALTATYVAIGGAFVWLWLTMLIETEKG